MADETKSSPAGHTGPVGDSFHNPALVGSGTILGDGTYGPPQPDPMVAKLAEQRQPSEPAEATRSRKSTPTSK